MDKRKSTTELVRKAIIEAIIAGKYRCGESLPSVEQLAKDFNISKNTVALALSTLNDNGIIEIAHGKSTRITRKLAKPHIMIYAPMPYNMESTPFWGEFYLGIKDILLENQDITSKLYTTVQLFMTEYVPAPLPERLDGVILLGQGNPKELNPLLKKIDERCPVVSIFENNSELERSIPGPTTDFTPAMRELFVRFKAAGVRRCAYIGFQGYPDSPKHCVNREKFKLFEKNARANGIELPQDFIIECHPDIAAGYTAVQTLAERKSGMPDAIFFTTDNLGPGAYKALRDMGLKAPEDILLAGCDNLPISDYIDPAMTTIELKRREQGRYAAEQIIAAIRTGAIIRGRKFPAVLINRKSTERD